MKTLSFNLSLFFLSGLSLTNAWATTDQYSHIPSSRYSPKGSALSPSTAPRYYAPASSPSGKERGVLEVSSPRCLTSAASPRAARITGRDAEGFDPVLGREVSRILNELSAQYPFNPEVDLGEDLLAYLRKDRPAGIYLTQEVSEEIEKARRLNRGGLTYLGEAFDSGTLPEYNLILTIKLLVAAAKQKSAPALYWLSNRFKEGEVIGKDPEKARILYESSINIDDASSEIVRHWIGIDNSEE